MIDEQLLRKDLQDLLKKIEGDIRIRLADEPTIESSLRERHAAAVRANRTEGSSKGYDAFASESITQSAVHWILGCVFIRFLEDNGWFDERNSKASWIAGPGERLIIAKDRRTLFLRSDAKLTDRDYLLHVFKEVAKLPGLMGLFDPRHNPLFELQPETGKGSGAARLIEFFQKVDPDTNNLVYEFTDLTNETRFLGDLYQNLSESARKRYALCQTPNFVVNFILDRTLTPALDTYGLSTFRLLDPSCGSGHFVLAAFEKLLRAWQKQEPGTSPPALAQRALDAVFGVDLNPFAVEITRFRLLIAALESSGIQRLKDGPNFRFNLGAGDSLLHGSRVSGGGIERSLFDDPLQHFFDTEDAAEVKRILGQQYHAVVGNPPYITVSDASLREAYRVRFSTCHGSYQLGVPFIERFLDLTIQSVKPGVEPAGWMGMIVSNAFMKRVFGKKLIEEYLCHKDLTHVIDTSGVYLPGHGTPTAILLARNQRPISRFIRAVRGISGEKGIPLQPEHAPVWQEILIAIDQPGFEGKYVSASDAPLEAFARHPWAIGGGGASELKLVLDENANQVLAQVIKDVGYQVVTRAEDAFLLDRKTKTLRIPAVDQIPFGTGEDVRNWSLATPSFAIWPYESANLEVGLSSEAITILEPLRVILRDRIAYGRSQLERGLKWFEYSMLFADRIRGPFSIAFGEITSHNHFVLDRGRTIFNQTAPVIKLPADATEDDYLGILGLLNCSTACFWLKQICFPKGGDHVGNEGARVTKNQWEERYAFDSTKLRQFPIPDEKPLAITRYIQSEAEKRSTILPDNVCLSGLPNRNLLDAAQEKASKCLARMVALQEELDWLCYRLYDVIEDDLTVGSDEIPELRVGERAFEILLARRNEEKIWFERHRATPTTELPVHWTTDYKKLVERRIAKIESNRDIALIERPEYKRRWNLPMWEDLEGAALRDWLLDRVECSAIWKSNGLVSCAQLRDDLSRDSEWLAVAEIYQGHSIEALDSFVINLVLPESVPFLAALRYTESGLRKRKEWETIWALQSQEDNGETVEIPLPPKYVSKDMQKTDYWRLRGGLDVPKERFISYPGLERDSDSSPVLGWSGRSHLEQAKALAEYFHRMRTEEGWEPYRLKPILAGMLDLRLWLLQWYNELDPELGERLGDYFVGFAEKQCHELGFSVEEVQAWQPPNHRTPPKRKKTTA